MAYKSYVNADYYLNRYEGDIIPEEELSKALKKASRHIDSLTYNRKQGKVSLVSSTPYARRLYFHPEYHFQKYENAFASGKWYEPWIDGVSADFCREAYKKIYKRLTDV